MRNLLRSAWKVASTGWLLVGCGAEPNPKAEPVPVQMNAPPSIRIAPDQDTLALGQPHTFQITVSGDSKPLVVSSHTCDTGSIAVVFNPLDLTLTVTAESAGLCFVWATLGGQQSALARVTIPPLPMGTGCSVASECAADAPLCQQSDVHCGKTCTRACNADADCPAPFRCAVNQHVCRAIVDPDDVCA
jgi:hypothetical protein